MISRRRYLSICMMMAVVLLLFQLTVVIRDRENEYDVNRYLTDTQVNSGSAWTAPELGGDTETLVYIGDPKSNVKKVVEQWCGYTKRRLLSYGSLSGYQESAEQPLLLCISGAQTLSEDVDRLISMAEKGQNMLFYDLPSGQDLAKDSEYMSLLGIRKVMREQVPLKEIRLFPGFLLGGEVIYKGGEEDALKARGMDFSVDWFRNGEGTKVYMTGVVKEEGVRNEYQPGLIWRNSYGDAKIFVVNGDYMYGQAGMGILSAMVYEAKEYDIYPVINAQNLSVVNFPGFSDENTRELEEIYVRNQRSMWRDLIWPDLIATSRKSGYQMTAFFSPQMDYKSEETMWGDEVEFFLRQLNEQSGEAGLSMDRLSETDLSEKLEADQTFYKDAGIQYQFGAAYARPEDVEELLGEEREGILKDLRTVVSEGENGDPLISYCSSTVTRQNITADGTFFTAGQDFSTRALETALGYANILADMKRVSWPESEEDHWEKLFDVLSSDINTYWNPFSGFEKTTMSESDRRVRSFLAVDYEEERRENQITLNVTEETEDAWFVLRTHGEKILAMEGGEYEELETDVFLIHALGDQVEIELGNDMEPRYVMQ